MNYGTNKTTNPTGGTFPTNSRELSTSNTGVPDYIPAANSTELSTHKNDKPSKKKLIVMGSGVLLGLVAVSSVFSNTFGTEPLDERVEPLGLEGDTQQEAENRINSVLEDDEDVVFDFSNIEEDGEFDPIVDNVVIVDDTVELEFVYHPYDIISNMEIIGTSVPDAVDELSQAGLERNVDYTIWTDENEMFVESNWSIIEVRAPESNSNTVDIVATNETLGSIEDTADDLLGSIQDGINDYNNTLEEEAEARAEGRTEITELGVIGTQWNEAERILYQNDWHSADYIIRTDTGMPVLNSRNWTVADIDTDIEDRPVVFLEK